MLGPLLEGLAGFLSFELMAAARRDRRGEAIAREEATGPRRLVSADSLVSLIY